MCLNTSIYVSSYLYMCVLIPVCVPLPLFVSSYLYFSIYASSYLHMFPSTSIYVLSYPIPLHVCPHTSTSMCPQVAAWHACYACAVIRQRDTLAIPLYFSIYASSYLCMCLNTSVRVLIPLHMCSHLCERAPYIYTSSYLYMCLNTSTYVFSCVCPSVHHIYIHLNTYICVLIPLHMCCHASISTYVSSGGRGAFDRQRDTLHSHASPRPPLPTRRLCAGACVFPACF